MKLRIVESCAGAVNHYLLDSLLSCNGVPSVLSSNAIYQACCVLELIESNKIHKVQGRFLLVLLTLRGTHVFELLSCSRSNGPCLACKCYIQGTVHMYLSVSFLMPPAPCTG